MHRQLHRDHYVRGAVSMSFLWQPMETAPKDGRTILAARFSDNGELCWVVAARYDESEGCVPEFIDLFEEGTLDAPTHWIPLPELPK